MRITVETAVDLETAPGIAEVLLDGRYIEPAGDLLSDSDGEVLASGLEQTAAFDLVLKRLALGFSALEDGIRLAKSVGECFV